MPVESQGLLNHAPSSSLTFLLLVLIWVLSHAFAHDYLGTREKIALMILKPYELGLETLLLRSSRKRG